MMSLYLESYRYVKLWVRIERDWFFFIFLETKRSKGSCGVGFIDERFFRDQMLIWLEVQKTTTDLLNWCKEMKRGWDGDGDETSVSGAMNDIVSTDWWSYDPVTQDTDPWTTIRPMTVVDPCWSEVDDQKGSMMDEEVNGWVRRSIIWWYSTILWIVWPRCSVKVGWYFSTTVSSSTHNHTEILKIWSGMVIHLQYLLRFKTIYILVFYISILVF